MVVVISGASAGIGKALAEQLSARGAKLALCARRIEKVEELNNQLGGGHLCVRADVAATSDCESFIARALERFGKIDTLVCNAGFGLYRKAHEYSPAAMRQLFATNVFGTTDLIHAAVPAIARQEFRDGYRGQVMIVSSVAARRGVPYLGPYSATKAAQLSIAEAMRIELRGVGIAVTSVHPIMTKTEFGQVAESGGDVQLPRGGQKSQSVEHVARRMVRAIEKPTTEVWPHRPTRWGVALATLMPGVADLALRRYLQNVEAANR
jgi:short-subunit dehydrogenase